MTACDLYLVLPDLIDIAQARAVLQDLLAHPEVTALRLPASMPGTGPLAADIIALAHQHDVAAMICSGAGKPDATSLPKNCDGLHLPAKADLARTRAVIGDDIQLGCLCNDRDEAMDAGEKGADYVSFPADMLEIATWWSGVMELPCVLENVTTPGLATKAAAAGVDFIAIPLSLTDDDIALVGQIISAMA